MLFLSREPQSTRKISRLANLADGTEARTLVRQLNTRLDQVGRAFHVREVAEDKQGNLRLTIKRRGCDGLVDERERRADPAFGVAQRVATSG